MRVLLVTTWFPSIAAPVSGTFVRKDAELIGSAHDVHVVHLAPPGQLSAADDDADRGLPFPVTRIPMSRSDPRQFRGAWRRLVPLHEQADVLHTQAFSALLPFVGRRVRMPWVHSEHWSGLVDRSALGVGGRAVFRATAPQLRKPDVVTTVSGFLAEHVRPHRRGPIMVVPSVVPPATVVAPPRDRDLIRMVAVGGLVPGKDPVLALETVRELRRRGRSAVLTWVGDGPLRASLEVAAGDAGDLVLLGPKDPAGVAAALDAADVFLLPTRSETLCLSALEAITHGRPVVIGGRGGQREYVTAENGRLVDERTAVAYADAVEAVWAQGDAMPPERIAASIGDRFHPGTVLEGYGSAYATAVQAARART